MQSLKESIKYTEKKKKHQLLKLENSNFQEPFKEIEGYIKGIEDDSFVGSNFEYLSNWYLWQFLNEFLDNKKVNYQQLANSTMFAIESNNWEYTIGKIAATYDSAVLFNKAVMHLGQLLYLGWDKEAIIYGKLLIKMLYGKQYKGWVHTPLYSWYMITLFCKWQNISMDYNKLNYPADMGVYKEVLDYWHTTNKELLATLVNKMVDFHIAQSDEYVKTDEEGNEFSSDFSSSDYFIFPVEILMWLNIRERMGLPDYTPDNDLMKMAINNWHTQHTAIPKIELIEKAKAKLLKDYPGIEFEI